MKRIGILGGCSPESTVEYYRHITREYTRRFGDYGYPEIVIYSVSFQRFVEWMRVGNWPALAAAIDDGLRVLAEAGADVGLIASNTFHRVFDEATASTPIRMVSLLDVVAKRLVDLGCRRAGLLGTGITMTGSFYPSRLANEGIETIVPPAEAQGAVDRIIFEELTRGTVTGEAKEALRSIAMQLVDRGAGGIVLGCTELPLLIDEGDLPVPILNTTVLHASAGLAAALA